MTEIERIKRYIQNTDMAGSSRYYLNIVEAMEMAVEVKGKESFDVAEIINLAFKYGKGKGCRAARAEQRKKVQA